MLEYSIDGGSSWNIFGSLSSTSALLLRATDQIRFTPDSDNGGTLTADYRAWDQTTPGGGGGAGTKVDVSDNGGTTAFSSATDRVTVISASVNDAPVLDNTGTMTLTTINEDQTNNSGNTIASIIASAGGNRITDVDAGAQEGIAITSLNSGNGTWQYSTNGGSSWTTVGSVSESSALLLRDIDRMRFVPDTQNGTNASFNFRAWDQTQGGFGSHFHISATGGTSAFSTAVETAEIVVTDVNDAPTDISPDSFSIDENTDTSAGHHVGTLTATDPDTGETFSYSIVGGADAGVFSISGDQLVLTDGVLDFETKSSYSVTVRVTDSGGLTYDETLTVNINDLNEAPSITSDGGGAASAVSIAENTSFVTTVTAVDPDAGTTLVYSISGGADASQFQIDSATGVLTFISAPDFEMPADVGGDNVYDVIVQVSDGSLTDTQALAVSVIDVSNSLVVTTTADTNDSGIMTGSQYTIEWLNAHKGADGLISLREAIIAANNTAGHDTINFDIAGGGVHTIDVLSSLPAITDAITIDGYSQSGASANTLLVGNDAVLLVELSGVSAGANANGLALAAGSDGSTIRGLVINRFDRDGIQISGSDNNIIAGNFLGTDASGNAAQGNHQGVNVINSSGTLIGGTDPASRNVISGNRQNGIAISGATSTGTLIQGNYVGTNAAGDAAVGNLNSGINILTGATDTTIGGRAVGAGNVISGNTGNGVALNSGGNRVQGNLIGLNASGDAAVGNGNGVYVYNSANNIIGGNTAAEGNVISGNTGHGVFVNLAGATGTVIAGNSIGTDVTGTIAIGNAQHGIFLSSSVAHTTIGGTAPGAGNLITASGIHGVHIGSTGVGNAVLGNSIYGNTKLGINHGSNSVYTNDGVLNPGADGQGMDHPVLTIANLVGDTLSISGYVGSAPDQSAFAGARVEVFLADVDASGYGEGKTFLGYFTADANGNFSGKLDVTGHGLTHASVLTATATSTANNTSEFGANLGANVAPTEITPGDFTVEENTDTSGGWVLGSLTTTDEDLDDTFTYAIVGGADAAKFSIAGDQLVLTDGVLDYTIKPSYSVTVRVTDSGGLTREETILVSVTDVNDAPVAHDETASAIEDGSEISGQLSVSDKDPGDTHTFAILTDPSEGAATVNPDGSFTFDPGTDFQDLAVGETRDVTFVYRVTDDGAGNLYDDGTVTVTVTGTNDAPVLTIETGDSAAETFSKNNSTLATSGTLTTSDLDLTDTVSSTVSQLTVSGATAGMASDHSDLLAMLTSTPNVLDATQTSGQLTWNFNSASETFSHLATGESLTLTYTITVTDSQGATDTQDVVISITGANDAPVVTIEAGDSDSETLAETDSTLTSSGTLTVSDLNLSDTVTSEVSQVVPSGTTSGLASDNAALLAMLNSTLNVVDENETSGQLTWDFNSASEAFDYLAVGESLTLTYTITVTDSQGATDTQDVVITIDGTNDAPVVTIDAGDSAAESLAANNSPLTTTGTLTTTDLDLSDTVDSSVTSVTVTGNQTGLSSDNAALLEMLNSTVNVLDGAETSGQLTWTFNSGSEHFDYLAADESVMLTYQIKVVDSQGIEDTQDVVITITGTNDAPVVTIEAGDSDSETLVETDTTLSSSGTLTVTDVNLSDTVSSVVSGVTVAGNTSGLMSDTAALEAMLTATSNVVDSSQTSGTLTWDFDSSTEAFIYLAAGDELTLTYTITVTDSQGATDTQEVLITIVGTNDAPIAEAGVNAAVEDGVAVSGQLLVNDVDDGDTHTFALLSGTSEGVVTVHSNGEYTFDPGADFQDLAEGETRDVTFVYEVSDSQGAADQETVTITVTGTNDAPVFTDGPVLVDLTETDLGLVSSGTIAVSDVDESDEVMASIDSLHVSGTGAGSVPGTLDDTTLTSFLSVAPHVVVDSESSSGTLVWNFDSGSEAFDFLKSGDTLILTYTVRVTDDAGSPLSDTETVTVRITGTNDAPVAVLDTAVAVEAGGVNNTDSGINPTGNVLANDTDPDVGDTKAVAGVAAGNVSWASGSVGAGVSGSYGTITIQADGSYVYTVDNSSAAVEALRTSADTLQDEFTYTMRDAEGAESTTQIIVTIRGANDAPVAVNDSYTTLAGQSISLTSPAPTSNDFDADGDDLGLVFVAGPTHGTLSVDLDGNITYTPSSGFFGVDSFSYRSDDGMLLSDNIATVSITVQAVGGGTGGGSPSGGSGSGSSGGSGDGSSSESGGANSDKETGSENPTTGTGAVAASSDLLGEPDSPLDSQEREDQATSNRKHAQLASDRATYGGDVEELETFSEINSDVDGRSLLRIMGSRQEDALVAATMFQKGLSDTLFEVDQAALMSWYLWAHPSEQLLAEIDEQDYFVGTIGTTLGIASIGYVLWALRGGMFVATMYAGIPSWRMLDPTALLTAYRGDDTPKDRVEEMLQKEDD